MSGYHNVIKLQEYVEHGILPFLLGLYDTSWPEVFTTNYSLNIISLQISSCLHRLKGPDNKLVVNTRAILDDFTMLGNGIVRDVSQHCVTEEQENTAS